jgi:hypothetical protein
MGKTLTPYIGPMTRDFRSEFDSACTPFVQQNIRGLPSGTKKAPPKRGSKMTDVLSLHFLIYAGETFAA